MNDVMVFLAATILTLPFLGWYLIYIITVKWTKKKGKAIRLAADLSTILFIGSVHFFTTEIFGESFLGIILLVILMTAVLFTIMHYRMREEVEFLRLVRGIWRFTFFLFAAGYMVFLFYGIMAYLLSAFIT